MDTGLPHEQLLSARIAGDRAELPRLRSALANWLTNVDVRDEPGRDLVLATHELAAEAIERGAEVALLGEVVGDAIRLTMAGGDWSSLDELRSTLVRGLVAEIRIHRGIVTMRLTLTDVSSSTESDSTFDRDKQPGPVSAARSKQPRSRRGVP
jgi:hypothetical protein